MSYLEEFEKLKKRFPRPAQEAVSSENCDWADHVYDCKNCYYVFDSTAAQDCMYTYDSWKETNSIDTLWNAMCERCYEVSDSGESTDCYFSQYLGQCYNMYYSFNCGSCHDCFGCVMLDRQEYCIFNVQYTQEEYEQKLPELKKIAPKETLAKVAELIKRFPKVQSNFRDNENSEYVNYIYKSRNSYYCFDGNSLEDCGYLTNSNECKDCWNASYCVRVENSAETLDSAESYNCYEIQDCARCYDSAYLYSCSDTHNCFMCSNLTNAKYCILNVQYSPEEYKKELKQIKDKMNFHFTPSPLSA